MERFAFIIHAIDVRADVAKKFPIAKYFPAPMVENAMAYVKPMVVSHITGIKSKTGVEAEGWFIGCTLGPRKLLTSEPEFVYKNLEQCVALADGLGAKVIGLGALTSVAGDGGITLAKRVNMAVTTGNSYTVATAVEGAIKGADLMGVPIEHAHVAIVGAAGSIGRTSSMLLAPKCRQMTLLGRDAAKLEPLATELRAVCKTVNVASDTSTGLKDADVIVTVTSAVDAVIQPSDLKPGAVVCDVARPRDVSVRVAKERPDVLVIEGGIVQVPGKMTCTKTDKHGVDKTGDFSFGFPAGTAYACMSETMMLALDQRYESFTLGKTVSVEQASKMWELADKHGFGLAGFRSFERAVTPETIAAVRKAAGR